MGDINLKTILNKKNQMKLVQGDNTTKFRVYANDYYVFIDIHDPSTTTKYTANKEVSFGSVQEAYTPIQVVTCTTLQNHPGIITLREYNNPDKDYKIIVKFHEDYTPSTLSGNFFYPRRTNF